MNASTPSGDTLVGTFITLERLDTSNVPELCEALGRPVVFSGGWGGGPAAFREDPDELVAFVSGYLPWQTGIVYGARVAAGPHSGRLVGTSTLGDLDLARESAHIGWTAWDPRVWGTQVNIEAKLLMLGMAFEHGFGRVKLQADDRNTRSRAAIAALGARFEGFVRRDMRRADGSWRDTAVFSVIIDDWPDVRAGLTARLAAFGENPVRFRTVP